MCLPHLNDQKPITISIASISLSNVVRQQFLHKKNKVNVLQNEVNFKTVAQFRLLMNGAVSIRKPDKVLITYTIKDFTNKLFSIHLRFECIS